MQSKWLLTCATPLLLPAALDHLPGGWGEAVRMGLLAEPATALASFFCSGPLARDTLTGWPLLPGWAGTVRVTPDCAGLQFWSIALAVALFHLLPGRAGLARLRAAAAGVLAAYALTLLLNASRILLVGVCQPFAQSWPDVLAGTLHLSVGVLVFLPGLIGFSLWLTRFNKLVVDRPRETAGNSGPKVGESREDPRLPIHFIDLRPEAPAESPTPPENSSIRTEFDSNSPRDSEDSAGASGPKNGTRIDPNSPRPPEDSAGASRPTNGKVDGFPSCVPFPGVAPLPSAFPEPSLSPTSSRSPKHEFLPS